MPLFRDPAGNVLNGPLGAPSLDTSRLFENDPFRPRSITAPLTREQYAGFVADNPPSGGNFLSWLGENLDKFGRTGRAAVAGIGKLFGAHQDKPTSEILRELLAFVPYSDTMGLTRPETQVKPRDIVRQFGMPEGWGSDLFASILTDPLTFLPLGAGVKATGAAANTASRGVVPLGGTLARGTLTETGKTLGRIGALPVSHGARYGGLTSELVPEVLRVAKHSDIFKNLPRADKLAFGQNIAEALRGGTVPLQGVTRLPFTDMVIGATRSPGLNRLIEHGVGALTGGVSYLPRAADFLRDTARFIPGVSAINRMFSGSRQGQPTFLGSQIQEAMINPSVLKGEDAARTAFYKHLDDMTGGLQQAGLNDLSILRREDVGRELRFAIESGNPNVILPGMNQAQSKIVVDGVRQLQKLSDNLIADNAYMGVTTTAHPDPSRYLHRSGGGPSVRGGTGAHLIPNVPDSASAEIARTPGLELIPAEILNKIGKDAKVSGANAELAFRTRNAARYIEQTYGITRKEASAAATFAKQLSPEYVAKQLDFFATHPLVDTLSGLWGLGRHNGGAKAKHSALAVYAIQYGAKGFDEKLAKAGTSKSALEAGQYSLPEALEKVGLKGGEEYLAKVLGERVGAKLKADGLGQFFVSKDVVNALIHSETMMASKQGQNTVAKAFAAFTNLFKRGNTLMFPMYQIANAVGGFFQNMLTGTIDATTRNPIARLVNPYNYAINAMHGGVMKGIAKKMQAAGHNFGATDAEVTARLSQMLRGNGLLDIRANVMQDIIGEASSYNKLTDPLLRPGERGFLKGSQPMEPLSFASWNPLFQSGAFAPTPGVRGALLGGEMGTAATSRFIPARVMETASAYMDRFNKAAHYISKLLQGVDPLVAKMSAMATHMDFRLLSPIEKKWMRGIFPFYTFARLNSQLLAQTFASNPGRVGALVKYSRTGEDEGHVPEHIRAAQHMAIGGPEEWQHPASGRKELLQKFMRFLPSLPHEEAFRWLKLDPGDPAGSSLTMLRDLLGQTHPLIRATADTFGGEDIRTRPAERHEVNEDDKRYLPGESSGPLRRLLYDYGPFGRLQSTVHRAVKGIDKGLTPWQALRGELTGVGQTRVADLLVSKDREVRAMLERHMARLAREGIAERRGGGYVIPEDFVQRLGGRPGGIEDLIRYKAYQRQQIEGQETALQRNIEDAEDARAIVEDLMGRGSLSTADLARLRDNRRLLDLLPIWRSRLRSRQLSRWWESMGAPGRNPLAQALAPSRREAERMGNLNLRRIVLGE